MGTYIKAEQDVRLFVEDLNPQGKKTIVFLHGWPANHNMFEYQYNMLAQWDFRCIGIDLRGFGKSDKPWTGYDYNRQADDVLAVVKALGLKNITLLGHSTAGAIAVRYMARHRGYGVRKLVLCAAAAPSLIPRPDFPYGQSIEVIDGLIEGAYTDRPNMLRGFGDIFFHQKVSQPFSDWFFQLGLEAAGWATIAVSEAWLQEELFQDLTKIRVPTLIMHGLYDQVVPYELGVAQYQRINCSRLLTFEHSGHGLFYDELDKFNSELAVFAG